MNAPGDRTEQVREAIREMGLERKFLCREPWESYYILRRGIMPCCYGAAPIAPMEDWATAWNSPALQEIRAYLAKGTLSPYCRRSTGCPIVQRYQQDHGGAAIADGRPVDALHRGPKDLVRRAVEWLRTGR